MQEFDIIKKYFKDLSNNKQDLKLDIGDDCAILDLSKVDDLLVTTDTLVAGTHFLDTAPAHSIGYKSLAVNLSDIAAMGGIPKWVSLALTMPEYNPAWLADFTSGFAELANKYNISLIGGDLTRGPLSITITAMGLKSHKILTRSGAKAGDLIFITGKLGLPSYILDLLLSNQDISLFNYNKLYYPEPKITIGQSIARYTTACIDLSDGLIADLGHILHQSEVSAELYLEKLPMADELNSVTDKDKLYKYILAGGDEYELIFTAPKEYKATDAICIGKITKKEEKSDLIFKDSNGKVINIDLKKYKSWLNFE